MGAGSAGWCPTGRCPASSQKNRGWDKAGQPGSKRVKQDSLSRVKRALTRLRLATRGIALQPIRKIGAIRVKTSFRPFPDQKSEIKNQKCLHFALFRPEYFRPSSCRRHISNPKSPPCQISKAFFERPRIAITIQKMELVSTVCRGHDCSALKLKLLNRPR
jgi:hypothetical protein